MKGNISFLERQELLQIFALQQVKRMRVPNW